MRATISFDIELDKVEETMSALVSQQSSALRVAANILDNAGNTTLLEEVTGAIDLIQEATSQLQQYQQMLTSFEKAKFETMLPQQAPASTPVQTQAVTEAAKNIEGLQETLKAMSDFGSFVDRINNQAQEEEETDGLQTQEG
jgi:ABC-type hemin transport system ATPase subunit